MTRARILRALLVVVVTIIAELAIVHLFVSRSYFRDFFRPIALGVLIVGIAVLWRTVRPRSGMDRREDERRRRERREG